MKSALRTMRAMHLGRSTRGMQAIPVAAFFFTLAMLAAALGLGVLSGAAADVARISFLVFLLTAFLPLIRASSPRHR